MSVWRAAACSMIAGLLWCGAGSAALAVDLDGAWADNPSACAKIFTKRGKVVAFAEDADLHGSGLIFEGNRIKGKMASCSIKSQKQDGDVRHLLMTCSTDVALETVQLSLKIDGENAITRIFPGMPELQMSYARCPL